MALTLNQAVKNINDIATSHSQINTFFFGELYDFSSSGNIKYPAMAVVLQPAQLQGGVLILAFEIYILDLVHKDLSNNAEVLSDTMQTCLDIIATVNNPTLYDWNPEQNTTLTDIQGGMDDEISGYWFPLKLRVPNPLDRCQVPIKIGGIGVMEIGGNFVVT